MFKAGYTPDLTVGNLSYATNTESGHFAVGVLALQHNFTHQAGSVCVVASTEERELLYSCDFIIGNLFQEHI